MTLSVPRWQLHLYQTPNDKPWGEMFESPSAVISKLTACSRGHPDKAPLTLSYPLAEIFNETRRFIEGLEWTTVYFVSFPTPSQLSSYSVSVSSTQTPPQDPLSQPSSQESETSSNTASEPLIQPEASPSSNTAYQAGQTDFPTALLLILKPYISASSLCELA
ncbi:hypothetical protein ETB97_003870 [Aspergillus alliaceus]|uniref:Uncharacterized protein n=1 Tax=Petromyces alliaceus TaxID=209559 RepID=A0A8H6A3H2_PETAA|nr:hypothetical protein ETB97_003870 [Aspergillus burnettii]